MRRPAFVRSLLGAGVSLRTAATALPAQAQSPVHARVRLGYLGTPCEAPTYAAPSSQRFRGAGLGATLVHFPDETALAAALDAGTIDAASINLPSLMRPLEAGRNVRVTAGLHAGCLRVCARDVIDSFTFGNLRGKSVATDRFHGPAMNLLWAVLHRQGIDPAREVTWRAYDRAAIEPAVYAKEIDCVALADPFAYLLLADKAVEPYIDTSDGGFSCGVDIAHGHHCFLALSGSLVAKHPAVARALTQAYIDEAGAIGRSPGAAALAAVRGGYVDTALDQTIGMLGSYDWNPASDLVLEELELTARDFRRSGLLSANTDAYALANRAFADVLGG